MSQDKSKKKRFHKRRVKENVSELESNEDFFLKRYDPDKTGDKGLWCGECRKRIPWKDLNVDYCYVTKTQSTYRQWFCGFCGNQLREDDLSDLAEVYGVPDPS